MKTEATGYWTFFCNPAKWQIDKFLSTNIEYDDYQITSWQESYFTPGQLGVVRVGGDTRNKKQLAGRPRLKPGVYGLVEVLSKPKKRKEAPDKYWIKWTEKELARNVVEIRYIKNLLNKPLYLKNLETDKNISDKYLLAGFQASTMPLDRSTFIRITKLIGDEEQVFENIKVEPASTNEDVLDLEQKYTHAVPEVKDVISKRIERGPIGNKIKKLAEYKCMICESLGLNPISFIKKDGIPYVEAHHIIPVSNREQGSLSGSNVISLCANHHRQLHYGDVEILHNDEEKIILTIDGASASVRKIRLS